MAEARRLRVMMLGLRGFPDVQGGVEIHAEHLCPELVQLGCDVDVLVRTPYVGRDAPKQWRGVRFSRIWSPRLQGLEAIIHSLIGVAYAGWRRPDILHIQAIGPALVTPIARLLGIRVVVTHHGPDYDRQKWGRFAKAVLRLGERVGVRYSDGRIAISRTIQVLVESKYGVSSVRIPNGVVLPELPTSATSLDRFGLVARRYVVLVSRIVPEKRHLDLIAAFGRAGLEGWKLALVGTADHPGGYSVSVEEAARSTPGVVMTGYQSGTALAELYAHAGLFVLPSSHEGLPIALLEALSYGLPVVASAIPANLEVGLDADSYYELGDIEALAALLKRHCGREPTAAEAARRRDWVASRYNWTNIAKATLAVYRDCMAASSESGAAGLD